jgi:hypothetical protein
MHCSFSPSIFVYHLVKLRENSTEMQMALYYYAQCINPQYYNKTNEKNKINVLIQIRILMNYVIFLSSTLNCVNSCPTQVLIQTEHLPQDQCTTETKHRNLHNKADVEYRTLRTSTRLSKRRPLDCDEKNTIYS